MAIVIGFRMIYPNRLLNEPCVHSKGNCILVLKKNEIVATASLEVFFSFAESKTNLKKKNFRQKIQEFFTLKLLCNVKQMSNERHLHLDFRQRQMV